MLSLLRQVAGRHAAFVSASAGLLGLFQFLICAAVASVDVEGALDAALGALPPFLHAAITTQLFGGLTPGGLVAFGWTHPIAQAAGTAVAIVLAARAIAGEAERGTIELVLAQPLSRAAYFAAHVAYGLAATAAVAAAGVAGSIAGARFFGLEPAPGGAWLRLAAAFALLQLAWFGLTLLVSSLSREGGRAASIGFLLALASYVATVIGTLWESAAWVRPWTLHAYFEPRGILVEGAGIARAAVTLGAVAAAGIAAAWAAFRRRGLP